MVNDNNNDHPTLHSLVERLKNEYIPLRDEYNSLLRQGNGVFIHRISGPITIINLHLDYLLRVDSGEIDLDSIERSYLVNIIRDLSYVESKLSKLRSDLSRDYYAFRGKNNKIERV